MSDTGMTASESSALMGASLATSFISTISGTISQAKAIKAQGSYAQSIARTNAALSKLKASQVLEAGDAAAAKRTLQTKGDVGSFRAAGGGSGVDVNSGSSAAIQAEIRTAGDMDVLTIKNNATRAAWGFETQAINDTFQGRMEKLTADSKVQQSIATGGLQAISGPLSIYGNYLKWSRYMGGGSSGGGLVMPWGSSGGSSSVTELS